MPSFTQPTMYRQIEQHTPVRELYAQKLIDQKILTPEQFEQIKAQVWQRLDAAHALAKDSYPRQQVSALGGVWKGMTRGGEGDVPTQVPLDELHRLGDALHRLPKDFTVHPKLRRILDQRYEMTQGKRPLDWGAAEMLALGSLLREGTPVRFVGQDVQRGTFSHRHACLHDYNTGDKYYPLANLDPRQADVILVNTMLSELAVLGFEYGFSSADPRNLVVWEAQFGDFVNGAQAIIDQFIAAAESKWQKFSGLVMLLPHGYEGGGSEHSNAYLDRFLALCAENNLQVCVPSVPSQYFHVLRRQMRRTFRRPLVVMTPKSLLRVDEKMGNGSDLAELAQGTFQNVIDDPTSPSRQSVRRVLLCSGKIYFHLNLARIEHGVKDMALVRVEQLYPFTQKEIAAVLSRYRQATEIAWVQEEPRNRGAWMFMRDRLEAMLPETAVLKYFGRGEAASPASGSMQVHRIEEEEILSQALDLPSAPAPATPGALTAPRHT
jgi:2-oxoglutarate dehydrogenase E1 component